MKTTFTEYDTVAQRFVEAEEDLSGGFVKITFCVETAPGVFQYPRERLVPLAEAQRLGALAAKQKIRHGVVTDPTKPHETGFAHVPAPTPEPKLNTERPVLA